MLGGASRQMADVRSHTEFQRLSVAMRGLVRLRPLLPAALASKRGPPPDVGDTWIEEAPTSATQKVQLATRPRELASWEVSVVAK